MTINTSPTVRALLSLLVKGDHHRLCLLHLASLVSVRTRLDWQAGPTLHPYDRVQRSPAAQY